MRRDQLEHILRAAADVAGSPDVVVIGSQAILGSFDETQLPDAAVASIEADIAFLDDPAGERSDTVTGAIGELSQFHETFGVYAEGVSVTTATLPMGWRDRVVLLDTPNTQPGRGISWNPMTWLPPSWLPYREKDLAFVRALLGAGLVDRAELRERIMLLPIDGQHRDRLLAIVGE
jgi:hypothetical protein